MDLDILLLYDLISYHIILNLKMIEPKKRTNENLEKLKGQMKDMSQDFEDMKNARIESKR